MIGERRRLNFKLEEDLALWAFSFAERNNTTVTQLIADHLAKLRQEEEVRLAQDAEQI